MKQLTKILNLFGFLAITISLSSCKKFIDLYNDQPDLDMRFCNIEKIEISGLYADTLNFTYDPLGNPISIIKNGDPGTGNPNYLFTYDTEARLYQAIGIYSNNSYESWKRFGYDNKDQIVKDTTWVFGVIGDNPDPDSYYIYENTYYYDAMGRIIKVTTVGLNQNSRGYNVQNYSYNSKGNLNDGRIYDQNTNINRTNRIWMFLNRDYSKNNSLAAEKYNFAKLPLSYNNTKYSLNFLGLTLNESKITYSCP